MKKPRKLRTAEIDGAPVGDESAGAAWCHIAEDPDDLLQHLLTCLDPFHAKHFIQGNGMNASAIADAKLVSEVLGTLRVGAAGKRKRLEARFWKALAGRDTGFFKMIAHGFARIENDTRAVKACIRAIEKHKRVPTYSEVLQQLEKSGTPMSQQTLTRHLRKHRVRLPQRGKQGALPRSAGHHAIVKT